MAESDPLPVAKLPSKAFFEQVKDLAKNPLIVAAAAVLGTAILLWWKGVPRLDKDVQALEGKINELTTQAEKSAIKIAKQEGVLEERQRQLELQGKNLDSARDALQETLKNQTKLIEASLEAQRIRVDKYNQALTSSAEMDNKIKVLDKAAKDAEAKLLEVKQKIEETTALAELLKNTKKISEDVAAEIVKNPDFLKSAWNRTAGPQLEARLKDIAKVENVADGQFFVAPDGDASHWIVLVVPKVLTNNGTTAWVKSFRNEAEAATKDGKTGWTIHSTYHQNGIGGQGSDYPADAQLWLFRVGE